MIGLIVYLTSSIILFLIFINIKDFRNISAAERNLKRLEEKKAYNTIDDKLLRPDFDTRIKIFFEKQVDKYVIANQKLTKKEELTKLIHKVYKNSKTYEQWEYERIIMALVYFCLGIVAAVLFKIWYAVLVGAIFGALVLYLYESNLKSSAKNKDWANFIFFPDMLMSLCMLYKVGAVSGIFQGFKKICKIYDHPLIDEIKHAIKEYDFNKDKYDVLNDLADSVDFKEFTSFVNIIIESEKNNIPVVDSLTEYAYQISAKRKILATNQILKLPEKIDVVMLCTSMPICFIYMILPSLSMAFQQFQTTGM